jgi:hypothetical protein
MLTRRVESVVSQREIVLVSLRLLPRYRPDLNLIIS